MKHILFYTSLLFVLAGCSKNVKESGGKLDMIDAGDALALSAADDPNDIMGFYSFIEAPANGTFGALVYNMDYIRYPSNTPQPTSNDQLKVTGAFYDANKNMIAGGIVTFGHLNLLPNPGDGNLYSLKSYTVDPNFQAGVPPNSYAALAGKTVSVTVDPTPGSSTARTPAPVTGSLYIPQKIVLRHDQMKRIVIRNNYVYSLSSFFNGGATDIVWWPDPNNTKGVVISVEYDYETSIMLQPGSPRNRRKYYRAFRVPDNGRFTLNFNQIAAFFGSTPTPYSAMVVITVGRANYAHLSSADGLQKYAVYAGSAVEALMHVSAAGFRP